MNSRQARPAPGTAQGRIELANGLVLDSRRAAVIPGHRIVAIADLHLGYAWVQRRRGALLPVGAPDDTVERLFQLQRDYLPQTLVVLGDVVHQATPIPALVDVLREVCNRLSSVCELVFCLGNHDRKLGELILRERLPATVADRWQADPWLLLHGDRAEPQQPLRLEPVEPTVLMGHEHPCVRLGDGVTTRVKVPAFLVADRLVVLPAFSSWAAGSTLGQREFLSDRARQASFESVYACLGPRLLRLPWNRAPKESAG